MKIGVIGAGAVGSACLLSSILRGIAREIVVVNREPKRAKAVVTDLQSGAALVGGAQTAAGARQPAPSAPTMTMRSPSTSTTMPRLSPGPGTFTLESITNLAGIVYEVRAGTRNPPAWNFAPQLSQLESATSAPPITINTLPTLTPRPVLTVAGAVDDMANPFCLRVRG